MFALLAPRKRWPKANGTSCTELMCARTKTSSSSLNPPSLKVDPVQTAALGVPTADHQVASVQHCRDQLRQQLRRMLQIRILHSHDSRIGMHPPMHNRDRFPFPHKQAQARIFPADLSNDVLFRPGCRHPPSGFRNRSPGQIQNRPDLLEQYRNVCRFPQSEDNQRRFLPAIHS
jgi:hypothetical protein